MTWPYDLPRVTTIPEFLTRLGQIKAAINDPTDGVSCFNDLYTTITSRVYQGTQTGFFGDPAYITALDVAFANRYLDALRDHDAGKHTPDPWRVLIDRRADHAVQSLQFAAAGVNAHINFDLPHAVLEVWEGPQGPGPKNMAQHDTYQKVDQIFAGEMDNLRHKFETANEKQWDKGRLDKLLNLVGDLLVDGTRDVAWKEASHMWAFRAFGPVDALYMKGLEASVGAMGDAMLVAI